MRWKGRTIVGLLLGLLLGGLSVFFVQDSQVDRLSEKIDSLQTLLPPPSDSTKVDSLSKTKYLIRETFDENANNWQEYLKDYGMKLLYDGRYIFRYTKPDFFIWSTIPVKEWVRNYNITLSCAHKSGNSDALYGLMLNQDKENYNRFCVTESGYATINLKADGEWKNDIAKNLAGFDDSTTTDELLLQVRDKKYQYYVNGSLVKEGFVEMDWAYIGVFVADAQTVEFTELTIVEVPYKRFGRY